ncbi:MAG: TatD family hydrolase [Cryomorphaceae bacterium]|nr:TatD family hydrolase [Cryomorphaceae bacterium]
MSWIDTHTHIYLPEFTDDVESVIGRALKANVQKMYLPNVDQNTLEDMLRLCQRHPNKLYPMAGLHPCSVKSNWEEELNHIQSVYEANKSSFIAVGEIGIDLFWDKSTLPLQEAAFHRQIEWALTEDLPIVIHVRDAFDETFAVVEQYPEVKGVFHCFTGTVEQAKWITSRGMYLGIGGVSTFKNGGMDKVLPHVDKSRVIVETDAPYLAPVPYRGKRNEPAYIPIIGQRLSDLWEMDLKDIMSLTTTNAQNLFRHG